MEGTSTGRTVGRAVAPPEIRTLAHERRAARLARDWATADRLKTEIEAGGWRVVDRGPDFALEPAVPRDIVVDGRLLYGAPERVPSLLDTPAHPGITLLAVGAATIAADVALPTVRAVDAADDAVPEGEDRGNEVVRVAGAPSLGELVEAGLRRVPTEWVVVVLAAPGGAASADPGPLLAALAGDVAADVAAVGSFGARTSDLHRFVAVVEGAPDLLLAGPIAARRDDLAALAPLERRIVSADRFAQWLSLALRRDAGGEEPGGDGSGGSDSDEDGPAPRRAIVIPGADAGLQERRAREASDDHLAKRDFYRVIDRFGLDPRLLTTDR